MTSPKLSQLDSGRAFNVVNRPFLFLVAGHLAFLNFQGQSKRPMWTEVFSRLQQAAELHVSRTQAHLIVRTMYLDELSIGGKDY